MNITVPQTCQACSVKEAQRVTKKRQSFLISLLNYATQRKIDRNEDDGWARSTMLGTAFRIGDVNEVARLSREVAQEGPSAWQLQTTLHDIEHTINLLPDSKLKQELKTYFDMLGSLSLNQIARRRYYL